MPDFSPDLQQFLHYFLTAHGAVVWFVLFGAAIIEYVFPPFPGDSVTLAGAIFVTAFNGSFWMVFSAVTVGSVVGSAIDFLVGTWLHRRRQRRVGSAGANQQDGMLDVLVARFRRHGAVYLVINRFLPGIRAMFFVAAGLAGMRIGPVLLFATISATAWNLAIIGVGAAIGANWERIEALVSTYTALAWIVVAIIVAIWLGLYFFRRFRSRRVER